jgi:hypothetical protein
MNEANCGPAPKQYLSYFPYGTIKVGAEQNKVFVIDSAMGSIKREPLTFQRGCMESASVSEYVSSHQNTLNTIVKKTGCIYKMIV